MRLNCIDSTEQRAEVVKINPSSGRETRLDWASHVSIHHTTTNFSGMTTSQRKSTSLSRAGWSSSIAVRLLCVK
jgi:hypothetical protein